MGSRERPVDRAAARARRVRVELGGEIRTARHDRGLNLREITRATGIAASTISRIERGMFPGVTLEQLALLLAAVGLDLSARAYPGGSPIRDAAHAALLRRFREQLHRELSWRVEVPLPIPGDPRAWDAMIIGKGWRYGVEAETAPRDAQALARRLELKVRDGHVNGVLLVLPATRRTSGFLREAGDMLGANFRIDGRRALELLGAGVDPGGNAIIVIRRG